MWRCAWDCWQHCCDPCDAGSPPSPFITSSPLALPLIQIEICALPLMCHKQPAHPSAAPLFLTCFRIRRPWPCNCWREASDDQLLRASHVCQMIPLTTQRRGRIMCVPCWDYAVVATALLAKLIAHTTWQISSWRAARFACHGWRSHVGVGRRLCPACTGTSTCGRMHTDLHVLTKHAEWLGNGDRTG